MKHLSRIKLDRVEVGGVDKRLSYAAAGLLNELNEHPGTLDMLLATSPDQETYDKIARAQRELEMYGYLEPAPPSPQVTP